MNRLAVFARLPAPGRVKTRLSPALPPALAARLYGAMLADTFAVAARSRAGRLEVWWASGPADGPPIGPPEGFTVRHQRGADLGERLAAAFEELLADPADRAVVIGADCPDLDAPALERAFAALDDHDLVLGPATDGGYYLVGLRRPCPALFAEVPWGTAGVLPATLERARASGLRVRSLDTLADLDTPADLVRLVARRSVSGESGPGARTESALREMGLLPPRG